MKTRNKVRKIIKKALFCYQTRYDEINEEFFKNAIETWSGVAVEEMNEECNKKLAENEKDTIDYTTEEIMKVILKIVYDNNYYENLTN